MAAVDAWGINLDGATQRWEHLRREADRSGVALRLHRLAATRGAALTAGELAALVSPPVQRNLARRLRVCDPLVLNTAGAVGASCSHLRCWEHVAAHADPDHWALVLEDDVCLRPGAFAGAVRALAAHPRGDWDAIQLGWHWFPSTVTPLRRRRPVVLGAGGPALTTWERDSFGAHAYALTRTGARRLLALARPLELHVDHFLAVVAVLGDVRGYAWPESVASQCRADLPSDLRHWDPWRINPKVALPDAPLWAVVLGGVLVALALMVLRTARRRDGR